MKEVFAAKQHSHFQTQKALSRNGGKETRPSRKQRPERKCNYSCEGTLHRNVSGRRRWIKEGSYGKYEPFFPYIIILGTHLCSNTLLSEDDHCLSGQGIQDHRINGTGLGTRCEIKPLSSQNHVDPPICMVGSQPLTLLALPSQPLVAPRTMPNILAMHQPHGKERFIQGHFRDTEVYQCLSLGSCTPSR